MCDGPHFTACVTGWEHPTDRDRRRQFETVWTVEPAAVRTAVNTCIELARRIAPTVAERARAALHDIPPSAGDSVRNAVAVTNRVVGYLDTWGAIG